MALDFPSSPSVGDTYPVTNPRWVFNGVSWVSRPAATGLYLPMTGGVLSGPGNLDVRGTLDVDGQATFVDGVTIDGDDAATKTYVDEAVASGGLWQGTWDASSNTPDLTASAVQMNGWTWAILTPDPTTSFTIPATPNIPGLSGVTVWNGDHAIWSDSASQFEVVHGSSLSLAEAQDMFLAKTGATLPTQNFKLENTFGANTIELGNSSARMTFGANGEFAIACGSNFDLYGNPLFHNGATFAETTSWNGGNLNITGSGTTAPTARGNVTITSTNVQNGNLVLNGASYGQGNITVSWGNIAVTRGTLTAANISVSNGRIGPAYFTEGSSPNWLSYSYLGDALITGRSSGGGGLNYVRFGGSEIYTINLINTRWDGYPNYGIQHHDGQLVFFPNGSSAGGWLTQGTYFSGGVVTMALKCDAFNGSQHFLIANYRATKPGGGVWEALSDMRTKTDVHAYTHGLAELTKLNPISFRYNGRARMRETGFSYVGLHAEEVAPIMPEMLRKQRGKLDYDDDVETDILHLDTGALTYALINAVKELTKRIEALEKKRK